MHELGMGANRNKYLSHDKQELSPSFILHDDVIGNKSGKGFRMRLSVIPGYNQPIVTNRISCVCATK